MPGAQFEVASANIAARPAGAAGLLLSASPQSSRKSLIHQVFIPRGRWPSDCRSDAGYPESPVPQVVSGAVTSANELVVPSTWATSPERAPDTPFASLLDAGTQAAAPAPQQLPTPAAKAIVATAQTSTIAVTNATVMSAVHTADAISAANVADTVQGGTKLAKAKTPDTGKAKAVATLAPAPIVVMAQTSNTTVTATTVTTAMQAADAVSAADVANTVQGDAKASKAKPPGTGKVKADATGEQAKAADGSQPSGDAKLVSDRPANTITAPPWPADSTTVPAQTSAPGVVAAAVPASAVTVTKASSQITQAAPAAGKVVSPAADQQAQTPAAADQAATAAATDPAKPDTAGLAPAQSDSDKPAAARPRNVATAPSRAAAQTSTATLATDGQAAAPHATGDAAQQAALTAPSPDVGQAAANATAPTPSAPQTTQPTALAVAVPISGVAVEIASMAQAGKNRFEIRLDPPELGRIEVRLDVDRDGRVTSHLIADCSDTLNLLQSDSSGLERALQDAGLKTTDNGLQFSLRDQGSGQQQQAAPTSNQSTAQIVVPDTTMPATSTSQNSYSRLASLRGGVDIRV